jgi:hypothetical protein
MCFDDVQWMDASSLMLLEMIIERCLQRQRERPVRIAFLLASTDDLPIQLARTLRRLRLSQCLVDVSLRPRESARIVSVELRERLRRRVDALAPLSLLALQTTILCGRPLPITHLQALIDADCDTMRDVLSDLEGTQFVVVSRKQFVHLCSSPWRAILVETMAEPTRAGIHRRIAEFLAPSAEPALVAWHYERANSSLAAEWYARAAISSQRQGDLRSVLEYTEKAEACGGEGELFGPVYSAASEAARLTGDPRAEFFARRALELLAVGSIDWLRASRVAIAAFNPARPPL